jgi:zinc transport system substrate-binding protein
MKKLVVPIVLIIGIVFVLHLSLANAAEKVQVVVSIPPQTYFVKQVGGDLVDVMSMLPEGASPHTFEPTAKQMKLLSQADMYLRIRVEFENAWWEKFLASNPDMYVVDSTVGVDFIEGHAHHHAEEGEEHKGESHEEAEEHHARDPHIWLSPKEVKIQTEAICEGLIHVDPANKATYIANKDAFLNTLDELDHEIQGKLANLTTRKFMIFHPAWSYFARDYNLEQLPIEIEGKEPSVAEMTALMKLAAEEQVTVIFVQPQASLRSADIIANQIGAKVEILNPLAANWLENMRHVTDVLATTLSQ